MNTVTQNLIQPATDPRAVTREERYISTSEGVCANLSIVRSGYGTTCVVHWNANQGSGWKRGWKATRPTEAAARAFAEEKWPTLVAWVEKTPSTRGTSESGAVAAFSAQVATLHR